MASVQRLAILPADVLVADDASQWMKVAVPLVLEQDFLSCKNWIASVAANQSGAYQIGATNVLRTTIEERNGRLQIQATLTDMSNQRDREVVRVESSSPAGLLAALNAVAQKLNPQASTFATSNVQALEQLTKAAQSPNVQSRVELLTAAIQTDPSFGLAYVILAQSIAQAGQDASPVIAKAQSHASSFSPLDRARFNLLAARVTHQPLAQQEQATAAVLQIAPNESDALAALGSERFLLGDAQGGEKVLKHAIELNPGNTNLQHELAIGLLETKRFADAEKAFLSLDNNAAVLPELATCVLLEGDIHRADAVFDRFLALRPPNDPRTLFVRGEWLAMSGRIQDAIALLNQAPSNNPAVRMFAQSQLSIWQLMQGDSAAAQRSADAAAQIDPRPNSIAGVSLLLTHGNVAPAQWISQVNALGLNDPLKQVILGYGLFLNRHYAEAADVWKGIDQRSGGADLKARALVAASLNRAGRADEASKIIVEPFVPEFGDLYGAVAFSEMHRLLGVVVR